MLCKNCGSPIEKNVLFCGNCGAKAEENESVQTQDPNAVLPTNDTVAATADKVDENEHNSGDTEGAQPAEMPNDYTENQQTTQEQCAQPQYIPQQQQYDANTQPTPHQPTPASKKSSKKFLFIALPVIAVLAVVALCFNTLCGTFLKMFGSNSSYLAYVEAKSIGGYSDTVTNLYGNVLYSLTEERGGKGEIGIEVGENLVAMLAPQIGTDLSWLKQIKIVADAVSSLNKGSGDLSVMLGEQKIADLEYYVDAAKGTSYFKCPQISDKYFAIKNEATSPFGDGDGVSVAGFASALLPSDALGTVKKAVDVLPEEKEVNDLINKYIEVALSEITDDDVEKSSESVTAQGVEQKLTVLKLNISEKLVIKMALAVIAEARDDSEILDILKDAEKVVNEEMGDGEETVNLVEQFQSGIDEALKNGNDYLAELDGTGETFATLIDYVDNSHNIVGRSLEVDGADMFSAIKTKDGSDIGYELAAGGVIAVKGSGTQKGDAVTGTFTMSVNGLEVLVSEVENFNCADIDKDEISGTITIKPGSEIGTLIDSSPAGMLSAINLSVKCDMDVSSNNGEVVVTVLSGEEILLKLNLAGEKTGADIKELPGGADVVDVEDIDDSDLDISEILDNLKAAGVPEGITSVFDGAAKMATMEP